MTHLKIEQNSIPEIVDNSVIEKLYELCDSEQLDNSSNLQGNLSVNGTYQEYIDKIRSKYQNLYITYNKLYLYVGDRTFTSILAQRYGDGYGCVLNDLQSKTGKGTDDFPNNLSGNTNITDATGLKYFTNINWGGTQFGSIYGLKDCTNLQKCELPEGMPILQAGQIVQYQGFFKNCQNLTYVVLPSTLTKINASSFENCSSLSNITIPNGVTHIGDHAFSRTLITQINLPSVLQTIGYEAFYNSKLTSIYIPSSVTSMNAAIFGSSITSIEFDQSSGNNLVWNTGSTYGTGIITYSSNPNSYLTTLDFPSRLIQLGQHPFRGLSALTTIIFRGDTPPTISSPDFPSNCTIYVPDNALSTYQNDSSFSSFYSNHPDNLKGISQLPST